MARYLTTTLPYVNASPHIGHALEFVQADAYARTLRLKGEEVIFNTGTDEHGQKIYEKALENGQTPQEYVDHYAGEFQKLKAAFNLSYDRFIRTTDPGHKAAAQEFWRRCEAAGDIYKKAYKVRYCVGCELEKTDSELEDGVCPLHPNMELQTIDEENYFFRFSAYSGRLRALYKGQEDFVIPRMRVNELISLIENEGLQDFSISRLKEKMPWGIEVPGDDSQVMYVWFDALVNYISTLGWPTDMATYEKFWPGVQFAGKDQVRQQVAMWQAMLMSVGLPTSRQIFIHGFVTSGGQKMSKSLGNTIDPLEYVERYGTDAVRYVLLRHIHPFEDSDLTRERFEELYTANLVNGLGNLVARVMKLAETNLESAIERPEDSPFPDSYWQSIEAFEFNDALNYIWERIGAVDERIAREEPFKVVKADPEKGRAMIRELCEEVYQIGRLLKPFLPVTSEAIKAAVLANTKPGNLFPRLP